MRKADKDKFKGKAQKTINFDKIVLIKLEEKCARENTTASNFVNVLVRKVVMDDIDFLEEMRKQLALKINEYDYEIDRLKAKNVTK